MKEEAIVLCPSILQSVLISQSNLLMSLITNENPLIFFCLGRLIADMNIPSSTSSHSRQLCINHLKRNINIEVDAYVSSFINKIMSIPNQEFLFRTYKKSSQMLSMCEILQHGWLLMKLHENEYAKNVPNCHYVYSEI